MPGFVTGVDIFFKIALAAIAAYVSYQFGAFKQQNDDIKLVVDLAFAKEDRTAVAGVTLASHYFAQKRIPREFYDSVMTSVGKDGNKTLVLAATSSANEIVQNNPEVAQQVATASNALPARVFFQISREVDRAKAKAIEEMLEARAVSPSPQAVFVPGIEFVNTPMRQTEVRCFRKEECDTLGVGLVEFLKENAVPAKLNDMSDTYGKSKKILPNTFEVWFSPLS
jgi:hypothetical protein